MQPASGRNAENRVPVATFALCLGSVVWPCELLGISFHAVCVCLCACVLVRVCISFGAGVLTRDLTCAKCVLYCCIMSLGYVLGLM